MRTVKQWLETLPEPYRTEALNNTYDGNFNVPIDNLPEAIDAAFSWGNSVQGFDYWDRLIDRATTGELDLKEPAPTFKPFDLDAAKAGKPVMMRNGTPIKRFLCLDLQDGKGGYPIVATHITDRGEEKIGYYTVKGEFNLHGSCDGGDQDLVMAPEKFIRYVNFYLRGGGVVISGISTYDSEDAARMRHATEKEKYLGAFPVSITL